MSIHALKYGFLAALLFGQERTPIAPTRSAPDFVSGRILHADGTPVRNAPVVLRANLNVLLLELTFSRTAFETPAFSKIHRTTTTDAAGAFLLDGIAPANRALLEVDAGASGVQSIELDPSERVSGALFPGDWELSAVRTLHGVVVDADSGFGVAQARIRLHQGILDTSAIDADHLASGGALLYRGEESETVWFPPSWFVEVLSEGPAFGEFDFRSTTRTASDGSFELPMLRRAFGEATLRIEAPAHPRTTLEIELTEGERVDAGTIRLKKRGATRIRVVDAERRPVRGAQVCIGSGRASLSPHHEDSEREKGKAEAEESGEDEIFPVAIAPAGTTDAKGELEAALPAAGSVWIAARGSDRLNWTAARIVRPKGAVEIVLRGPRSLDVRLVGPDGNPMDGEIACFPVASMGPCADLDGYIPLLAPGLLSPGVVRTQSGSARLTGIGGGHHFVVARAPGHALVGASIVPVLPLEPIMIRLPPLHTRSIRVLGPTGGSQRPVLGAIVKWRSVSPDEANVLPDRGTTATDAEGRTEIRAPRGGTLGLEVSHSDFAPRSLELDPSDSEVTVVLGGGGSVAGRIHRAGQPPLEPLKVVLSPEESGGSGDVAYSKLEALAPLPESKFRFLGVPPGCYRLSLSHIGMIHLMGGSEDGFESAERTVVVGEGEDVEIEIDLGQGVQGEAPDLAYVAGKVRTNGTRPELEVWIDRPEGTEKKERHRFRAVAPDGSFTLGRIQPGEHVIDVRIATPDKGYADLAERKVEVEAEQRANFEFELDLGGPVLGIVRSRATGEPIEGANVRLCAMASEDASDPRSWRFSDSQKTLAHGGISWSAVPSGGHWVRVLQAEHVPHYARIEVLSGAPLDLGEIFLDQAPPVTGRVIDAPSAAGCLRFDFDSPPQDLPPRFWLTFDAGHAPLAEGSATFSTRELRPGRYWIRLEDEDSDVLPFRPITVDVGPGGLSGLELRFEPL